MNDPTPPQNPIAEQNTQRLLAQAYHPELPDPAFARQVKETLLAAHGRRTYPALAWRSFRMPLAAAAAFVVLGVAVVLSLSTPQATYQRDGQAVVINGERYEPVDRRPKQPSTEAPRVGMMAAGLTAKPAASQPATESAQVGQTIRTQAGQKRRVSLADGSVMYVNQNTAVTIDAERRVSLASGEVYLEVSPRKAAAQPTVQDPTFVVKTPHRQVAALGTHFDVKAVPSGTDVVVTQGRVDVEGTDVYAGQELPATDNTPVEAPRATFILDWIRELVAAANTPLVPGSQYDGGSLIAVDPWGQEVRLTLRNYVIDVYIEDGFARTTIDQTYFNNDNWQMEGTFYFPLPADASLSRLAMYVDGNLMEGGMCEREEAREVYETIVNQRKDPALLEWVDGTTFKMRVFPLEARKEKRIILSFTQKLDDLYGRWQYRFPAGHTMNMVRDWSFHAVVKNGAKLPWNSSSHELAAKTAGANGQDLVLDASAKQIKPNKDVVFSVDVPATKSTWTGEKAGDRGAGSASFATTTYEGQRYVMLRYRPVLASAARQQRRDWVFLFESSGARDPLLARAQVEIVKGILANAQHEDTFAIVTAGTRALAMSDEPLAATPENIAQAVAYLEKTHLIGALDLGQALDATAPFVRAAKNPYLVHLGSGQSVLGERAADKLVARIPAGAHYVGVGVGKNWSRQFMKSAAAATGGGGGYFTQINPDEPVAWRAFDLVATLNTPRLLDVRVSDSSGQSSFLAFEDSLTQGEELAAIARYPAGQQLPSQVLVTGTLDGKPFQQVVAVDTPGKDAAYLPRIWAKLEIDRLLAADSQANKASIVSLSKAMYVMSPFTSLLVLENEAMYAQYKVDRGRKDHWAMYPAPEKIKVVYEPDPLWTGVAGTQTSAAGQNQTAQQVLSTVLVRIPPQPLYWPDRYAGSYYSGGGTVTAWNWYQGAGPYAGRQKVLEDYEIFSSQLGLDHIAKLYGLQNTSNFANSKSLAGVNYRWAKSVRDLDMQMEKTVSFRASYGWAFSYDALQADNREKMARPPLTALELVSTDRKMGQVLHEWSNQSSDRRYVISALNPSLATLDGIDEFMPPGAASSHAFFIMHMRNAKTEDITDVLYAMFADGAVQYNSGYYMSPVLTYQRPSYSQNTRVFSDLLQYAPGMNTLTADVQATLEAEAAAEAASALGTVDADARALLDRARRAAWRTVAIAGGARSTAFTLTFDGQGRYRYERTVSEGLRETVICDGKTLWHLYPELGVGARRTVSRFHQGLLTDMVPWALPAADDLAHGCDVTLLAPRVVAVVPTGAEGRKDDGGKVVPYVRVELTFAADGRLAERRWVEITGNAAKTLARETYSVQGLVVAYDEQDKEVQRLNLAARDAAAPELTASTDSLVVLPLPYRSRAQVLAGKSLTEDGQYNWPMDVTLAMIGSDLAANPGELPRLIATRFFSQGDHRIGFYTLLMASNNSIGLGYSENVRGAIIRFDPMEDFPGNLLARYYADQQGVVQNGSSVEGLSPGDISKPDFLPRLAAIRNVLMRLPRGDSAGISKTAALDVARACKDPYFGWAITTMTLNYGSSDASYYRALAQTAKTFEKVPGLSYAARYEEATAVYNTGGSPDNQRQAALLFKTLYLATLEAGSLPPVDYTFRSALTANDGDWLPFMREAGKTIRTKYGPAAAILHAWQINQLSESALAEELFSDALAGATAEQRLSATLTGVMYLRATSQQPRAAKLLEPLLADGKLNTAPELWALASQIAYDRGMVAQGLSYQEQALDLEYEHLPDVINLNALRTEYSAVMNQYLTLARAMATLHQTGESQAEVIAKVVRAADRWRAVDPDKTACCQLASQVFTALDVPELAWDYLTTPLAEKSSEAQPWANLAGTLKQQGDFTLADRAYATAFEVEPTNAQVLWDRAMLQQQQQRFADAKKLFQQLADGKWEPRFSWLQSQAKNYVQSH